MNELVVGLGVAGLLGLAITSIVLAIRNGGLKADARDADTKREIAEENLKNNEAKHLDYKKRAQKQIADLMEEIDELEDQESAAIAAIKDPRVRRARRRARVLRLLSEEANAESGEGEHGVSNNPTTKTSGETGITQ